MRIVAALQTKNLAARNKHFIIVAEMRNMYNKPSYKKFWSLQNLFPALRTLTIVNETKLKFKEKI